MTDLGTLGGPYSIAWDVNDHGQVVGASNIPEGQMGGAFLWQDGILLNLGTLGGTGSDAFGINKSGQIVGWSQYEIGNMLHSAFLWEDGIMFDLGELGGFNSSIALAINSSGQVLGSGDRDPGGGGPFLYDEANGFQQLSMLIPFGTGWSNLRGDGLNDFGQITGYGAFQGINRGFLMTPIFADFDRDAHTGADDAYDFLGCFGSTTGVPAPCKPADLDRDNDVDLVDFRWVQNVYENE